MTSRTALLIFSIAIGSLTLGLFWMSPSPMPAEHSQMFHGLVALLVASGLSFLAINAMQEP